MRFLGNSFIHQQFLSLSFIFSYRMLQEDPLLFQLYKDLVVSQVISADEFWANRLGDINNTDPALYNNKQEVGISGAFLVSTTSLAHLFEKKPPIILNVIIDENTENFSINNILLKVNRLNFLAFTGRYSTSDRWL